MVQWALEPAMSWAYMRLSTSMEALISSITAAGPALKRPPHMALADGFAVVAELGSFFVSSLMVIAHVSTGPAERMAGEA
jgi:hypothetical protein